MNAEQKQRLQMDRRAQGWLAEHPDVVASTPQLSQQTDAFSAVVAELSVAGSGQDSHFRASMGATAEASRLRRVLIVDQMQSIATVAKVTVPDVVRMTAALRMPRQGIDAEGLLTAADAMATEAQRYQDVLVQQALPSISWRSCEPPREPTGRPSTRAASSGHSGTVPRSRSTCWTAGHGSSLPPSRCWSRGPSGTTRRRWPSGSSSGA